jgi:hypothetical protein
MTMKTKLLAFFLTINLFGCTNKTEQVTIVADGRSNYSIVVPTNADADEFRAATFLQEHFHKISGVQLPVLKQDVAESDHTISIAKNTAIAGDDGFSITFFRNSIIIEGGAGKGCIYAVGEMLDKYLGVRYYSPDYIVIPESKNISVPKINLSGSSPNTYRNVNGAFTKNEDYKDFHRLHTIQDMYPDNYYVHTFHKLLPWKEYFSHNPDYYAYMNGKRIIDQICLTNEEVYELVFKKLREEMSLQPEKKVWSVSQDDNYSHCQCAGCQAIIEDEESAAGPIIHFVNRLADEFPDKIISTLAYQYSRKAPKIVKPRENVQIMLCTIELNRSEAIESDPTSSSFLKDLEDWGKISNHIYLWDYTVNFNHHISPFPNLHTLQPNIRLFVDNNVKEHFQQTNTGPGHEFSELKSYLIAKLLWNPDANTKEIIRGFTDGYYGAAGKWIRNYINEMETEIRRLGDRLDIYEPPTNHQHGFLSQEKIDAYNHYFDEAEKAVSGEPQHLLHVLTARMPLQYAIMEIGKSDMFGPRGWYLEQENGFVTRQEMTGMLERFNETSIGSKVVTINEAGISPADYYTATRRFIEVQIEGNLAFRKKVIAYPPPSDKYSRGDLAYLTNGVRGANDYNVHWIGWEAQDFTLMLDLEQPAKAYAIEISTLWFPKSWILHPLSVACYVSRDGEHYTPVGREEVTGDQRSEEVNRLFSFVPKEEFRYAKFDVKGTLRLFDWHPSAGGGSWVFVDEIVVR